MYLSYMVYVKFTYRKSQYFRWLSRRSFDLGNRRKLLQSGWFWLISGTQSVFWSDSFSSFGFKKFWDAFENRSTIFRKWVCLAVRLHLPWVCVWWVFVALISVLILLFTLFLHLICRVFVFVVRLCLLLQFVCVFFFFFLIKCRYLYFPIRCMSVHLYLSCCVFVYTNDLAFFLVVRLSLTWLCLCWSLRLPCVCCVCHLAIF